MTPSDPTPILEEPEFRMDERRGWHLDRGINPAYIVPLISAILAGLAWAGTVNSAQAVQDEKIGAIEKKVGDMANKEDVRLLREDIRELSKKMDRFNERR